MADSTTNIPQLSPSESSPEGRLNELFDAASAAMVYGRNAATCTGRVFGYLGGRWGGDLVANGTSGTLTASTTQYMVVDRSDGSVSFASTTTNWDDADNYARAYKLSVGASTITAYEDHRAGAGGTLAGSGGGGGGGGMQCIPIACGDETTALTTGTAKVTFRMPYAFTLTEVRASLTTAPTGSALTVDINEGGSTILSTKITIDATEKSSVTAATPPVISDASLADDAEITIDIDTVGSTLAGVGLKVYLIGTPT